MRNAALGVALVALAGGAAAQDTIAMGTPFPTLAFPRLDDGRPASVADFRGRKLVLHVFASW